MEKSHSQKEIFLKSEADNWFYRNSKALEKIKGSDPIIACLDYADIKPDSRVLEIGCSNGWRLNLINERHDALCWGVDPSQEAILDGKKAVNNKIHLKVGTADNLEFEKEFFDTVILGFFLYLVDREDLFKIAFEVDRVLKYGGNLIIYDFDPGFPRKNEYHHLKGVFSYKQDYSKMFL